MMSNLAQHLEEDQLLRYADGELPARKAREAKRHLEACWQCRAELKESQDLVNECVRYRKNVLQNYLPSPPVPWGDIYQGFAKIDASRNDVSLFVRIARLFSMRQIATWTPVALATGLVVVAFLELRQTPSVEAAELLRKAVLATDSRPQKPHHIHIRTSKNLEQNFQARFLAANYSWDNPLSAKSYQAWRDRLSEKHDEVTTAEGEYRIRTTTASSEIKEATITLKTPDLEPRQERLQFRDDEWVEITQAPEDIATISNAVQPPVRIPSHQPANFTPPPATAGDELHVLAALHGVGADLGDPIEVARNGNQIVVSGVGIEPQRQQEIRSTLEAIPNVVVKFSEPAPAPVQPQAQPDGIAASSTATEPTPFQTRLEKQAGGRQRFEQFSAQVLDMSDTMMSRAYALRRLTERFSPDVESQLSAADRKILRNVSREHTDALAQQEAQIEKLLGPVLISMGASPGNSGVTAGTAEDLFRSAKRVETLLAILLGATAGEAPNGQLPTQVLSALAELRLDLELYKRLSLQESGGK